MITIVDYGVGNIGALENMFDFLGVDCRVSGKAEEIARAEKLLLPGVGAFDTAMSALNCGGLTPALAQRVLCDRVPILGVCLGMQLFCRESEEGKIPGLGWIDASARRLSGLPTDGLKIPHVGWADISPARPSWMFPGSGDLERFYFVHSYHVCCRRAADVAATISYGAEVCCAISVENIHGVQFHPEKSHRFGMRLLKAFGEL